MYLHSWVKLTYNFNILCHLFLMLLWSYTNLINCIFSERVYAKSELYFPWLFGLTLLQIHLGLALLLWELISIADSISFTIIRSFKKFFLGSILVIYIVLDFFFVSPKFSNLVTCRCLRKSFRERKTIMVVLIVHLEKSGGRRPERDKRNVESKTNRSWFRHKSNGISARLLA